MTVLTIQVLSTNALCQEGEKETCSHTALHMSSNSILPLPDTADLQTVEWGSVTYFSCVNVLRLVYVITKYCFHLPISIKLIVEHVVITGVDGRHQSLLNGVDKVDSSTARDLKNFRTVNWLP